LAITWSKFGVRENLKLQNHSKNYELSENAIKMMFFPNLRSKDNYVRLCPTKRSGRFYTKSYPRLGERSGGVDRVGGVVPVPDERILLCRGPARDDRSRYGSILLIFGPSSSHPTISFPTMPCCLSRQLNYQPQNENINRHNIYFTRGHYGAGGHQHFYWCDLTPMTGAR